MIIENRVECETCDAVLDMPLEGVDMPRFPAINKAMEEAGWRTVSNWMDLCPLCSKENALSTIKKGTIVVTINEGHLQEVYCIGVETDYILVDYDDHAIGKTLVREGYVAIALEEDVRALIVIERRRRDEE